MKYSLLKMNIAIIYNGILGNINRGINSLRRNLFKDEDEYKLFIVTRDLNINRTRCVNKMNNKDYKSINIRTYNEEELYDMFSDILVDVYEFKGTKYEDEYNKERIQFKERCSGYCKERTPFKLAHYYNKGKDCIGENQIERLLEQYYTLKIGLDRVKEYEDKHNMKFDYVMKFRERVILSKPFPWDIMKDADIISPQEKPKRKLYICEQMILGKRDVMFNIFMNFYKIYGKMRFDTEQTGEIDITFSPEIQLALYLKSLNVKHVKMPYIIRELPLRDITFGESLCREKDFIEREWLIF